MTTEQYFNCIFCKETFDNKEDLQIHFRKHGDPKFNQNTKNRSRPQSESPNTSDKSTEENEMVGCDVCEEVFPTISKAITHKHKMHPDHDAKYFCPFCGKLFTMKHLYNKHIQTNHDNQKSVEKSDFQCECCDVIFYLPSAMMYHNKFFHRQDTELPTLGQSKKVKLYSQVLLQIYYCSFCGEEFNNKVNLHKHIGDDHSDENQSPSDVLKCPLCEALFYHLDAYEVHLMFHSSEDIYSEKNETAVDEITEFSLETVPPIVEKIEDEANNINDMEDFLQLVMGSGESVDNDEEGKIKSKKHKKHKKSKKAAITLDEFLNMNKDVFGDGIDVHGIEEVPTQVVLKKYKGKKQTNAKSKAMNADIDKLKKHGIVVKSKKKTVPSKAKNILQKKESEENQEQGIQVNSITAQDDVLSKLIRQSSSQIKIVKKSVPQNENKQSEEQNFETTQQNKTNVTSDNSSENNCKSVSDRLSKDDFEEECMHSGFELYSDEKKEDDLNDSFENSDIDQLEVNKEDTMSPYKGSPNSIVDSKSTGHTQISEYLPKTDNDVCNEDISESKDAENNSTETISALKRLSHLITVKSVKQNQIVNHPTEKERNCENKEDLNDNSGESSCEDEIKNRPTDNVFKAPEVLPKKICRQYVKQATKTTGAALNSTNIVAIKTLTGPKKDPALECKTEENIKSSNTAKCTDDDKLPQKLTNVNLLSRLTNVTAKPISSKINSMIHSLTDKEINISQTQDKKGVIDENIEIFNIDDSDSEDAGDEVPNTWESKNATEKAQNTNFKSVTHSFNKNITVKPCQQKPNPQEMYKTKEKDQFCGSKDTNYTKVKMHSSEIQKSVNLQNTLKNLGSNITVKTKNSSFIPNKEEDIHDESDYYDSDPELDEGKVKITEVTDDVNNMEYETNDDYENNVFVQSPDETNAESDSNNTYDNDNNLFEDIESQIQSTTLKKSSHPKSPYLDNFKNYSNNLTIKPLNEKVNSTEGTSSSIFKKEMYKQPKIANKNIQLAQNNEFNVANQNVLNQKTTAASNEVNTVKTVKKFQTQTVIQEVTTVTRTIRTVNEATNEIVQSTQTAQKPSLPQNTNKTSVKEYYGKVVRHASPTVGTRVMNVGNIATVRPSNQMVPMRPPALRAIAPSTKQIRKPTPPTSSIQKPIIGKLKISPNIINQTKSPQKRPSNVTSSNNLKKPKVSNALVEMSSFKGDDANMEYTMASTSQSNFTSTTKVVQGKSTVMTSQTRSEVTNMQQQLNKLSGMSGLKVMKTSTKQAMHVEEKSESIAPKSHTLEAIEKLQKIGLLVKKPSTDFNEDNEQNAFSESDEESYEQ